MFRISSILLILLVSFASISNAQQATGNPVYIFFSRIGPYEIYMNALTADSIAGLQLSREAKEDYTSTVIYKGEKITIQLSPYEIDEKGNAVKFTIFKLSTMSDKLRTYKGIGVGSTKSELLDVYQSYPNFTYRTGWQNEQGKEDNQFATFYVTEKSSNTNLFFILKEDVVVEIMILPNEGC